MVILKSFRTFLICSIFIKLVSRERLLVQRNATKFQPWGQVANPSCSSVVSSRGSSFCITARPFVCEVAMQRWSALRVSRTGGGGGLFGQRPPLARLSTLFESSFPRTHGQGHLCLSWCLTAVSTTRAFYGGWSRPPWVRDPSLRLQSRRQPQLNPSFWGYHI